MPLMSDEELNNTVLVNRYRLIHQVGKGGMALVYKGYDQMLERPVAVKLLRQDFSEDKDFRERFKQEAKSAANLSHPNIVTVHDFGVDPAGVFIVMEYISGTDLKSKITEKGSFSVTEGIPLMIQACAGLGYAHRAGIVHCDVKPQNMLISRDQRLKITDFGIARALSSISQEYRSEVVWGSPQYFAPEQALGEAPSPASDVYSLGVVMYELFTGHLPFDADNIEELTRMHQTQEPLIPSSLKPDIPPELDQIILKLLAKEPASRYRTADQLGHVLLKYQEKPEGYFRITSALPPDLDTQETQRTTAAQITPEDYNEEKKTIIDWKLIWLELLTILSVGGLIPFWMYVWFKISPFLK